MKLGVKFSLGLGAILLIVLAQAMYSINASHLLLRRNVFERTKGQVGEIKQDILHDLDFVREDLELFLSGYPWEDQVEQHNTLQKDSSEAAAMCEAVSSHPLSRAMRDRFINYFMDTYGFTLVSSVTAVNRLGWVVAQTSTPEKCNLAEQDWWRLTVAQGPQVLDTGKDQEMGGEGLVFSARLFDESGFFAGALKAVVPIHAILRNLFAGDLMFGVDEIDLYRKNGKLIFSTRAYVHGEDHSADPLFLRASKAKEPFVMEEYGERSIVAASWLSEGASVELPWLVVFKANYDVLLGASEKLRNRMALISLGALLLASLVAVFITRGVVGPISRLCQSMTRFGEGDMDARATEESKDELGMLARAFNSMAGAQQRSKNVMENEIAMRRATEAQLESQTRRLESSNKELEQFAYVASHDLQEPLRIIVSYLQLLQKRYGDLLDADGLRFLESATNGANRMRSLIRGLLEYSRITSRGKAPEPVDAAKVMTDVCDELAMLIEEKKAKVRLGELPVIAMDPTQVHQLLLNLVGNGLKYNENESPEISVWGEKKSHGWEFHVKDNGIGIESKYFDRIFGVFQRLHSRAKYSGTGIGLALCRRIVERHGGTITVQSEPGQGSTFNFYIPEHKEKDDESQIGQNTDG